MRQQFQHGYLHKFIKITFIKITRDRTLTRAKTIKPFRDGCSIYFINIQIKFFIVRVGGAQHHIITTTHLSNKYRSNSELLTTLPGLTGPRFELWTSRSREERVAARPTERFCFVFSATSRYAEIIIVIKMENQQKYRKNPSPETKKKQQKIKYSPR